MDSYKAIASKMDFSNFHRSNPLYSADRKSVPGYWKSEYADIGMLHAHIHTYTHFFTHLSLYYYLQKLTRGYFFGLKAI